MEHTGRSRLFMIASMVIFGTVSLFVRYLPITSGELALCRAVSASVPIGLYLLFTKKKKPRTAWRRQWLLLMLSGLSLGINWILLFEAYKHTTVSTATLCYYFAPVIVTVVSPLIFRERMTKLQALCFVMSTIGLVLITGFRDLGADGIGILLGLGAACFYATVILLNKAIRDVTGLERTLAQFIFAAVALLPYVLLSGGFHLSALDAKAWGVLTVVGLVHTALAYCLYFSALDRLAGQEIAILSYVDPLVAVIISVFVLSEPITALQVVGGVLILGFSLLNEWKTSTFP
ncbi:MAG: EamA family transporter [Clostridia bacterium]|nr:EamA family transporter [Clostridia bacterium]